MKGTTALITLLVSVTFPCLVSGLIRNVPFPLIHVLSAEREAAIVNAFAEMVEASDFLGRSYCGSKDMYAVPALGDTRVTFKMGEHRKKPAFVLSVDGGSKDDFSWICAKILKCKAGFEGIDTSFLESAVQEHFAPVPNAGYDAAESKGGSDFDFIFSDSTILTNLTQRGFVVIDTNVFTSRSSNKKLSRYLGKTSVQSPDIRRDNVAFLGPEEVKDCGLETQFNLLMAIASHLNDNIEFEPTGYNPIFPATVSKPLTNPECIQAAEYGEGGFYIPHRDTSFDSIAKVKSNFRCYTCILYCNDNWSAENGGALRIYPNSKYSDDPGLHIDILPKNGRLLVFDSMLLHSVEKVIGGAQRRRALTLWIKRPDDSRVKAPRRTADV
jgi:predicted 2-oxoglutarate/Fe(II)-dependent dioxygenase YbiX